MKGTIEARTKFRLDDRWSILLNQLDVSKIGLYRACGSMYTMPPGWPPTTYETLLKEVPEDFFCPGVAHAGYLGFHQAPIGLLFRDVQTKDFRIWLRQPAKLAFYVSQKFEAHFDEFRFGMPIVLCEGILDVEAFAVLTKYPFVIGYLTSGVTHKLATFLCTLTDKFLLVPDNDKQGRLSRKRSTQHLNDFDGTALVLETRAKDFGDVLVSAECNLEVQAARAMLSCIDPGLITAYCNGK